LPQFAMLEERERANRLSSPRNEQTQAINLVRPFPSYGEDIACCNVFAIATTLYYAEHHCARVYCYCEHLHSVLRNASNTFLI
jgi:hypothetical protein